MQVVFDMKNSLVRDDFLYMNGRRGWVAPYLNWVDHLQRVPIGKPELPIAGPCGRPERSIASLYSFGRVKSSYLQSGIGVLPPPLQFLVVDPDESTLRIQPKGTLTV